MSNKSYGVSPSVLIWMWNESELPIYIPAIAFSGILLLFGIVGNSFVLYAYRFRFHKTCATVYTQWLAVLDLFCCSVSIPYEIFQIRFPLMYGDAVCCKLIRTLSKTAYIAQVFMLICIALDRYFKICRPMKTSMLQSPHRHIVYAMLLSVCTSWPTALVYGATRTTTSNPEVIVSTCALDHNMTNTIFPSLYFGFYILFAGIAVVVLFFCYAKILKVVLLWKNSPLNSADNQGVSLKQIGNNTTNSEFSQRTNSSSSASLTSYRELNFQPSPEVDVQTNPGRTIFTVASCHELQAYVHRSMNSEVLERRPSYIFSRMKAEAQTAKTTFIFVIITVSFALSYIPYLTAEILIKGGFVDFDSQTFRIKQILAIAVKTYCINNASNPIIYSVFNPAFRKECCRLFQRQK